MLSRRDLKEVDQVVTFFSKEDGRVDLLARGLKKITSKNASGFLEGGYVEIDIADGKQMRYVTKGWVLDHFSILREDVNKSMAYMRVLSLLSRVLKEHEPHSNLFEITLSFARWMNSANGYEEKILSACVLKICVTLGFMPELEDCVRGGTGKIVAFDIDAGGIVRESSFKEDDLTKEHCFPLTDHECEFLQVFVHGDWAVISSLSITKEQEDSLLHLVKRFTEFHLHQSIELHTLL